LQWKQLPYRTGC